jgi:hypothetical protein
MCCGSQDAEALLTGREREQLDGLASTLARGLPKESVLTRGPPGPATVEAAREHDA